jgi:nucleoside-diphosphate-sugar epimerase
MPTKRVIVTGGSGKAGLWIVSHFLEQGYDVINVDSRRPANPQCRTIVADLTDLGQVITSFSPHNTGNRAPYAGVVHMAAIPHAFGNPNDEVFRVNCLTTYNVLEACGLLGIKKAVIASSESSYGFCFANKQFDPDYLPIDEGHPQLPEDTYGLTKVVNEATAAMFHRRDGTQILSYRIGNVVCPEDYAAIEARLNHPEDRQRVLWSYIDSRDLAVACRLGIEKSGLGCEPVIIAADYSSSHLPTAQLIKRYFPKVKQKRPLSGHQSLIANARAKKLLGWKLDYGTRAWKPTV